MNDDPSNLPPEHWERLVSSIVAEAEPYLEARRTGALVFCMLRWARPALTTAALLAGLIASAAVLKVRVSNDPANFSQRVPRSYEAWSMVVDVPNAVELNATLEGWTR